MYERKDDQPGAKEIKQRSQGLKFFRIAIEGRLAAVNSEVAGQVGGEKADEGQSGQGHEKFLADRRADSR